MYGEKKIRVVLAEDHSVVRQGILHVMEQTPDIKVIGEAENGEKALEICKDLKPDVLIIDVRMPFLSGIEVIRSLKDISPETKSLVLSAYDDDDYVFEAMANGASGYILKTTDANELPDFVRRANNRQTIMDPIAAAKLSFMLSSKTANAKKGNITPREQEIIDLAAQGLRNKAIAKQLNLSVRTVEGHFSRILTKLSVSSRIEAIRAFQSQPRREYRDA